MRLNLNETVKVKLTERGEEIYRQYFSPLPDGFEQPEPRIDEDGFTEIQLWVFMEMFGEHMSIWQPNVIEPLEIIFDNEEEIVHCKDCKWFDSKRANFVDGYGYCERYEVTDKDSHYCSYGEKQDTGKLESVEKATSEDEESTMGQPKSKLESEQMREYIPKDEVLDIIKSMPRDLVEEYVYELDGIWLDDDEEKPQLSSETSTNDLISRQAAIELACWRCDKCERQDCEYKDSCKTMELLDALPSEDVKPPMLNNDCISRQAAIEAVCKLQKYDIDERNRLRIYDPLYGAKRIFVETEAIYKTIYTLPPVEPKPVCEDAIRCYEFLKERIGSDITDNAEEFEKWFERMVWHVQKCNEHDTEMRNVSKDAISRNWILRTLETWQKVSDYNEAEQNIISAAICEVKDAPPVEPERPKGECRTCKRCSDHCCETDEDFTRCPIEEHYALPKDGYCHLYQQI